MAATGAPATPVAPLHVDAIAAPAFTPGWQDEAVGKLAHIVLSRHERAELKLNPAELGPVNIRVEMRADQATIMIVAASPDTRSALEQSLPQLRDLLASQGIALGEASVRDHAPQRDGAAQRWVDGRASDDTAAGVATADTVHVVVRRPDRMVDVFA
jgi:flagellar hook-length control protein FliK